MNIDSKQLQDIFDQHRLKVENLMKNETTMDFCGFEIEVDKDTLVNFKEWVKRVSLPDEELGAIGGEFTYCITPTSLGNVYIVKHTRGEEFNLTNYGLW
jgi:hypothetical protein